MPLATVIQLLTQFGLPLAQQIYVWVKENKTEVTDADWALLNTLANYRSADSLKAAGIQIVDGKVVPA